MAIEMAWRVTTIGIGCMLASGCGAASRSDQGGTTASGATAARPQAPSDGERWLAVWDVEALVRETVAARAGVEPRVECPGPRKVAKGDHFECQVEIEGVKGVAALEQQDADAFVQLVGVTGLVISNDLERSLTARILAGSGTRVTVDCGARAHTATIGHRFRCHATDDQGDSADIAIEVTDIAGHVDFEVVPPSLSRGVPP